MRHNDPADIIASCLKEIHNDVEVEPLLQPLSGEVLQGRSAIKEDDARSDIRARGFWTQSQNAFFDVKVFYPHASSLQSKKLSSVFKSCEQEKKRQYNERILQVEHGSFTPLIFSACGGMGREAQAMIRKLAQKMADKRNESYPKVITWIRCRLAFSLARSAIRCIRGSRSIRRCHDEATHTPVDLVLAEVRRE